MCLMIGHILIILLSLKDTKRAKRLLPNHVSQTVVTTSTKIPIVTFCINVLNNCIRTLAVVVWKNESAVVFPDGFSDEFGVTFRTTIIDKFAVAFGHEGETLSLGCTVIVYPTVKRYTPEVLWYRDSAYTSNVFLVCSGFEFVVIIISCHDSELYFQYVFVSIYLSVLA